MVSDKLKDLLPHHFIYKHHQLFLQNCKENLKDCEAVIILDLAKNYTFVVQDAIQSFHWNNAQATIHPLNIYFKKDGKKSCLYLLSHAA